MFDYKINNFTPVNWSEVKLGDLVRVGKDESFPADMLFLYSKTDVIFVDTMSLDGETNLKPKLLASREAVDLIEKDILEDSKTNLLPSVDAEKLCQLSGTVSCELPNQNLEHWDANLECVERIKKVKKLKISNLLLRGCYLRNTEFVYGLVVYLGKETKIMKNAKKPPHKVSNLMRMMNYMLYTVFLFQVCIIVTFASLSIRWIDRKGKNYSYINVDSDDVGPFTWFVQLLTYWVAYSHMIPISLYVIIEVLKLVQSNLIKWDDGMHDSETNKQAE